MYLFVMHVSFFTLMVVLGSGIKLGWLIYFVACPNEVISGRLVNTCSVLCNSCRCCIETCLTFPELSCTSKALSEIFLQIWKLDLYFKSNVSLGVCFLSKTMSPYFKICFTGIPGGGGDLSLAIFKFKTAIM